MFVIMLTIIYEGVYFSVTFLQINCSFAIIVKTPCMWRGSFVSIMPDLYFHFLSLCFFLFYIYAEDISPHFPALLHWCIFVPLQCCPLSSQISHVASRVRLILCEPPPPKMSWHDQPILHVLIWEHNLAFEVPPALAFLSIPWLDLTWCHASEHKFSHVQGDYFHPQDNFLHNKNTHRLHSYIWGRISHPPNTTRAS